MPTLWSVQSPTRRSARRLPRWPSSAGAIVFRGSEDDVLARYIGAAKAVGAGIVMRVTSDCPLIDPDVCDRVLARRQESDADYASNLTPRSFPQGLDCEAFRGAMLDEVSRTALPVDREHVTPWFRRVSDIKRETLLSGDSGLAQHRWTMDYPEDVAFLRAIFACLPNAGLARMNDVLSLLRQQPEIAAINYARRQTEFIESWREPTAVPAGRRS